MLNIQQINVKQRRGRRPRRPAYNHKQNICQTKKERMKKMAQIIEIKLQRNQININLDEESTYEEIIRILIRKIQELKNLYKEDKTPILITGKILNSKEIQEIKSLIQSEINVEVKFESPEALGLHGIRKTYNEDVGQSNTLYHRGSLRSGQKIENEGSIVIIGDVNSGAEVIAGANIVILGKLMG